MREPGEYFASAFVFLLITGFTAVVWCPLAQESTSNWWKTEIVRRGYGTWETTPDGQVWFKWKEPEAKP